VKFPKATKGDSPASHARVEPWAKTAYRLNSRSFIIHATCFSRRHSHRSSPWLTKLQARPPVKARSRTSGLAGARDRRSNRHAAPISTPTSSRPAAAGEPRGQTALLRGLGVPSVGPARSFEAINEKKPTEKPAQPTRGPARACDDTRTQLSPTRVAPGWFCRKQGASGGRSRGRSPPTIAPTRSAPTSMEAGRNPAPSSDGSGGRPESNHDRPSCRGGRATTLSQRRGDSVAGRVARTCHAEGRCANVGTVGRSSSGGRSSIARDRVEPVGPAEVASWGSACGTVAQFFLRRNLLIEISHGLIR